MNVQKNITAVNRTVKNGRTIKYIVLHFTGNKGDTAYANTAYFKSINRGSSAHYFVNEASVWQCVEDKDVSWHCGTKGTYFHKYCRNDNSIGVEMCDSVTRNSAVEARTAELVRYLMGKHNIPIENVIRHYDVTHKKCPAPLVGEGEWNDFKRKLEEMGMTEIEKAKMNEIATALEVLRGTVSCIDDSLTNLYASVNALIDRVDKRYNSIDEVPLWYRESVDKLVRKGVVRGDENGRLGLTEDFVKTITILDRAGVI